MWHGIYADPAGNLTSTLYGDGMTYDLASRLASVYGISSIHHTARNERLTVNKSDGTREVHMRGLGGGEGVGLIRRNDDFDESGRRLCHFGEIQHLRRAKGSA